MSHRKSTISRNNDNKSGYNYQKEAKQLKKDIKIKDEKIMLLKQDLKLKQDHIDLLQQALKTKEEELLLKYKDASNKEQHFKILTEKAEVLEKHNDELIKETQKQTKIANAASKRLSVAEETNMNLLNQINSLITNLNNLQNVNVALSSQLTIVANQMPTSTYQPIPMQTLPNSNSGANAQNNVISNNNNKNGQNNDKKLSNQQSNNENAESADDESENNTDRESLDDFPPPEMMEGNTKRTKPKKRQSVALKKSSTSTTPKFSNRKRSKSNTDDKEKEIEMEKEKTRKSDKKPKTPRQKSHRQSRRYSKTVQQAANDQAANGWDDDDDHKTVQNDDDDFFGNAPVQTSERSKKRKKKKSEQLGVSFDTYLDNIESDKLKITKGGRMVSMDYFTDSLYVISSTGFSSGKHEWEMKVLKTGDLTDEIGVCSDWGNLEVNGNAIADMGSSQLSARAVYANDTSSSVAFHDAYDNNNKLTYDKKFKKQGTEIWSKGDVIKVALNLNKWAVKFYLNNKQVGKSVPLTKDLTYYPILCAYGNCCYQCISYS